jgi:hypothetical protein
VRGGVIDAGGFYAATTAKIVAVAAADPVSLEDASLATWVRPADRAAFVYYDKGSLAGLLFDVLIRDASDNARSLDTVMRELYERTYKRGGGASPPSSSSPRRGARRAGATSARCTAATCAGASRTRGGRPSPRGDASRRRHRARGAAGPHDAPRLVGRGAGGERGGARRADAAGVRLGDRLVSVGAVEVRDTGFVGEVDRLYAGAAPVAAPFVVRRGGRTLALPATLGVAVTVATRVLADPGATARAARIARDSSRAPGASRAPRPAAQRAGGTSAQRSSSAGRTPRRPTAPPAPRRPRRGARCAASRTARRTAAPGRAAERRDDRPHRVAVPHDEHGAPRAARRGRHVGRVACHVGAGGGHHGGGDAGRGGERRGRRARALPLGGQDRRDPRVLEGGGERARPDLAGGAERRVVAGDGGLLGVAHHDHERRRGALRACGGRGGGGGGRRRGGGTNARRARRLGVGGSIRRGARAAHRPAGAGAPAGGGDCGPTIRA